MRTTTLIPAGRARRAILLLAAGFLLVIGSTASQAADPFVAGGRSTRSLAIDQAGVNRAAERAAAVGKALGLPEGRPAVERHDDRFEHQVYDEITTIDGRGRPVAITRLDPSGRLLLAVALGWREATGPALDARTASVRARAHATAGGLHAAGEPDVRTSAGAGGWSVLWPRIVDGRPVRGDGLRVALWADGSLHSISATERPLAPRPARLLDRRVAEDGARRLLDRFTGRAAGNLALDDAELAWIAPNDTFEAGRADAPDETLRLAWIVRATARGDLADRLHAVEVWIDAGDGTVLGGDLAE